MDRWLDRRSARIIVALMGLAAFELVARGVRTQARFHEICVNGYPTTTYGSFLGWPTFMEGVFSYAIALVLAAMLGVLAAVIAWVKER